MDNGRRIVLHPALVQRFRNALAEAKSDLHAMHFEHLCQLADLKKEIAELREALQLLVTLRRQQAEGDLTELRRRLEAALARIERRDPSTPLH
jgi:hypothetical protein